VRGVEEVTFDQEGKNKSPVNAILRSLGKTETVYPHRSVEGGEENEREKQRIIGKKKEDFRKR